MVSQKQHIILISLGFLVALGLTWVGFSNVGRPNVELPGYIKDALPQTQSTEQTRKIELTNVVPYPNEIEISTYPTIQVTAVQPLHPLLTIDISPRVSFTKVYTNDNKTLALTLQRPLRKNTKYTIRLFDNTNDASYSWAFTTGDVGVDQKLLGGIERVKQQLPYKDPNGRFEIYYAPQTDVYFITVHDDERSDGDRVAALNWLKSQGITNTSSITISWQASAGF